MCTLNDSENCFNLDSCFFICFICQQRYCLLKIVFIDVIIQERLDELHRLWDLLMSKLREKKTKLEQALKLVQFVRECNEVMFWINDKVRLVTSSSNDIFN